MPSLGYSSTTGYSGVRASIKTSAGPGSPTSGSFFVLSWTGRSSFYPDTFLRHSFFAFDKGAAIYYSSGKLYPPDNPYCASWLAVLARPLTERH